MQQQMALTMQFAQQQQQQGLANGMAGAGAGKVTAGKVAAGGVAAGGKKTGSLSQLQAQLPTV
jgi:hypothetical protein